MDYKQETLKRVNLLSKAKLNKKLPLLEMEKCKRDILYWFNNYMYVDKNQNLFTGDEPLVIPFTAFPFQEELITEVWNSIIQGTKPLSERNDFTNVFIEKSRQMGVSWVLVGIFVYGFIFHSHKYLMLTQKEDDVDKTGDIRSLFEKVRFIIRNLPSWMLPPGLTKETGNQYNKFKSISRSDTTGAIMGESANPNASRGGTYNAIFLDEFAFMQNASAINTSSALATPCRIWNATPNGEGNEYYRMRKLTVESRDENGNVIPPQVKGLRYHRSEHPLYTEEWYKWKIQGMTKEKIAQELEIDYNTAIVGRVYAEFPKKPQGVIYDFTKPLFVAIDNSHGGKDPHAVICFQMENHYINVIDAIEVNCSVPDMASFLAGQPKHLMTVPQEEFFNRYKNYNYQKATFISDPYDTHSTQGVSTIFEYYKEVGIYLNTYYTGIDKGNETQIMRTRANIYRIRYNRNCEDFASALMNAKYPERGENSTSQTQKPIHDWTSHYRTALEYAVNYVLDNPIADFKKKVVDTRPIRNYATGELIYK